MKNTDFKEKMTNYRWIICAMLFFATTVNYLDRQVLSLTWKDFIAPEFHWTDSDYGTNTGTCRALTPDLIELHNKYGAKGLRVVGVDVWERNEEAGPEAAKEMNIPYPILYGGTQETTDLYGIMGIPTVLVIDNAGTIIARDIHGEELNATVANYFEKK